MGNDKQELSARYYIAEAATCLLGASLVVARYFGLSEAQSVPILDVTPERQQDIPRILAMLLVASVVYMYFEWKQSPRQGRSNLWARARIATAFVWSCAALWLSYPIVAEGTSIADVNPAWFVSFLVIGTIIGALASILIFASFMIRTREEVKRICLPRIPLATRAQYLTCGPVILVLLFLYFVLWHFAPPSIKAIASLILLTLVMLMIGAELGSLYWAHDDDGNRITFRNHIAQFRKVFDVHDYGILLVNSVPAITSQLNPEPPFEPKDIQEAMRRKYSIDEAVSPKRFNAQTLENMSFRFIHKDGNAQNKDLTNCGVDIRKEEGKKDQLRVLFIPEGNGGLSREMTLPIVLVKRLADEYILTQTRPEDITFRKIMSHAINQSVIITLLAESGPLLYRTVWTGQVEPVRKLLQIKQTNVNELAEYGWTALLAASAQGYTELVRLLLAAGANPDIGNVHNITPLMYSAHYGNSDISRSLLEYGARPNLQDVYGWTALMVATRGGHEAIVEMLLNAGADTTIKDRESKTALDYAHATKHGNIAKRLRGINLKTGPQ